MVLLSNSYQNKISDGLASAESVRRGCKMPQVGRSFPFTHPSCAHLSLAPARTRVYLYVLSFGGFKPNPLRPQSALRRSPRPRRRRLTPAAATAAPTHPRNFVRSRRARTCRVIIAARTPQRAESHRGRAPTRTHHTHYVCREKKHTRQNEPENTPKNKNKDEEHIPLVSKSKVNVHATIA